MKSALKLFPVLLLAISLSLLSAAQDCGPINAVQLKKILTELGHDEIKDIGTGPGKEKYEVAHKREGFTVPVGYEISPSTNYIWLTVFLSKEVSDSLIYSFGMLKENAIIQPCQFYITSKGNLMMGLAVENRGVTNAILRRHIETITKRVVETQDLWDPL